MPRTKAPAPRIVPDDGHAYIVHDRLITSVESMKQTAIDLRNREIEFREICAIIARRTEPIGIQQQRDLMLETALRLGAQADRLDAEARDLELFARRLWKKTDSGAS